jgi:hypothetical protein
MSSPWFDHLVEFLTSIELLMALLWLGLAIFTVALAILMYTRWGLYKPLRKCMAMSLLAHLLMAGYAATVEIISPPLPPQEPVIHILLSDEPDGKPVAGDPSLASSQAREQPWEAFSTETIVPPQAVALERRAIDPPVDPPRLASGGGALPGEPNVTHVALADIKMLDSTATMPAASTHVPKSKSATTLEAPPAQRREAPTAAVPGGGSLEPVAADASAPATRQPSRDLPAALLDQVIPLPKMTDDNPIELLAKAANSSLGLKPVDRVVGKGEADEAYGDGNVRNSNGSMPSNTAAAQPSTGTPGEPSGGDAEGTVLRGSALLEPVRRRTDVDQPPVPETYKLRIDPNRAGIVRSHGGTGETEAAVKAALKWLADNQAADGRWDPRAHLAGREANIQGRNRQNAGSQADTAMTGLALLAFLGSGHTHLDGPYRDKVRRGLEFLMETQAPDGNLGGRAAAFEFMYCHAMAACALSEAFGLTHDERLEEPVRRAVTYTTAAQDPKGGGWRYKPGDPGDTSQLGWQLMSLKSAELAGIPMSSATRQGVVRYLQRVSSGKSGGLASYRPGEQATHTMTAEALVCWLFLGLAREHPACAEASASLMGNLPDSNASNLYYWYYATLGMHQLQDEHWPRWNEAVRTALLGHQIKQGPLAGSWDTNDLWAGHGGRIYTTALATLTLEVYYRFLPLYGGGKQR